MKALLATILVLLTVVFAAPATASDFAAVQVGWECIETTDNAVGKSGTDSIVFVLAGVVMPRGEVIRLPLANAWPYLFEYGCGAGRAVTRSNSRWLWFLKLGPADTLHLIVSVQEKNGAPYSQLTTASEQVGDLARAAAQGNSFLSESQLTQLATQLAARMTAAGDRVIGSAAGSFRPQGLNFNQSVAPGADAAVVSPFGTFELTGQGANYELRMEVRRGWWAEELANKHSGLCLDIPNGSMDNGVIVQQYACHGGANQLWFKRPVDADVRANGSWDFYWEYVNLNSGLCLDVANGSTADGAQIVQYECHQGANQAWREYRHVYYGSDMREYYTVSLYNRNSGKCLDIPESSLQPVPVEQYTCHYGDNQQFYANKVH